MKLSYFEALVYHTPQDIPAAWPAPPGYFDPAIAEPAFSEALEQGLYLQEAGFDWVSVSEHHYASGTQTPTPVILASFLASHLKKMKIAMFGPHMPLNNPVRVAEELAMLDNLAQGRLLVGLLRGTNNEFQVYSVNPEETRDLTTEGMEIVLKAWTEPQPFSWEGRHYQYRSVSVWPRTYQQPHPAAYVLGNSPESCEFAAKHHLGLGVSFGTFETVARSTRYYKEQCHLNGWDPKPEQIIFRGRIHVSATDEEAELEREAIARHRQRGAFPMRPSVRDAVNKVDPNPFHTGGAPMPGMPDLPKPAPLTPMQSESTETAFVGLPANFFGGPESIIEQVKQCQEIVGAGAIDFFFSTGEKVSEKRWRQLEIFTKQVLPAIKDL